MINYTSIRVPTKYQSAIREIYTDEDGCWVTLNPGFYASGMGCYNECHVIHADTHAEVLRQIRQIKHI